MPDAACPTAAMRAHTSVRHYDSVQLTREQVEELIVTAQAAATSNFRQAYSAMWITDEAKRKAIGELAVNELQYTTCGAAFVICVDFYRLMKACESQGKVIAHDSAENILIGCTDAAIFAQNLVAAAEAKGYGTCFIGGIRTKIQEIDALLGLPELVFPLVGLTIGTRAAPLNEVKPRLPLSAVLFENSYPTGEHISEALASYDTQLNDYFMNRSSNARDSNWTKDMAVMMVTNKRPFIKAFLASKGFTFA